MSDLFNHPLNRLIPLGSTRCGVRLEYTTDLIFSLEGGGVSPRVTLLSPGDAGPEANSVELPEEWIPTGSILELPGGIETVMLW